ncbi:MAG: tetratricopeptide repeat protein [Bradymonadales bacterium]|jgi:Tfp pilus assembly protein PilF
MRVRLMILLFAIVGGLSFVLPAQAQSKKGGVPKLAQESMEKAFKAFADKQFAAALSHCEKAMKSAPKNVEVIAVCMLLYQRNERHAECLDLAQRIRKLHKDADKEFSLCDVEGISYYKLHRWDDAIASYSRCSREGESDAGRSISMGNLAEIYMVKGDLAGAEMRYREALSIDPKNIHAQFGLVVALMRQNKIDEARELYIEGALRDPKLRFFSDAFFEPAGELDYHRATLSYLGERMGEAEFYLKRYLQYELPEYFIKDGEALKNRIAKQQDPRIAHYPILLESVTSIAIDPTLRYMAMGTMEGGLYLVDLKEQKLRTFQETGDSILHHLSFKGDLLYALNVNTVYVGDLKQEPIALYYYKLEDYEVLGMQDANSRLLLRRDDDVYIVDPQNFAQKQIVNDLAEIKDIQDLSSAHSTLFRRLQALEGAGSISPKTHRIPPAWGTHRVMVAHPSKPLYALASENLAILFDDKGKVLRFILQKQGSITRTLAFDASGKYLVIVSSAMAEIWSLEELGL